MSDLTTQQGGAAVSPIRQKKENVRSLLMSYQNDLTQALPKFLTADKLIQVALTAMIKTPALLDCTRETLVGCMLTSAQLGLLPDGILGEAYLIPFNNTRKGVIECTFIVGYRGLIALALRSGQVKNISARAVFKGDAFEYELGLDEKLTHKPCGNKNPNEITHFYAIVRLMNGGTQWTVLTAEEVNNTRDNSANYKFAKNKPETVWGKYYEEMGCKTTLRRLMKYVPLSTEVSRAIGMDEQAELGTQGKVTQAEILDLGANTPEFEDAVYTQVQNEQSADDAAKNAEKVEAQKTGATAAADATMQRLTEIQAKKAGA